MLTGTIDELRTVALASDDASGYFPALYARVTERIQLAASGGRFDDPERMERFARSFAHWYLRARTGEGRVPGCWQAPFDVAGDPKLLIVQHLLMGINAHVNHDLPQVVVELAGDGDLSAIRADFDAVNDVLADTLPVVVSDLGRMSRWVSVVAMRGGGDVFNFSLGVARSHAWNTAERLHGLEPERRRSEALVLDDMVRVLAYVIANPGWHKAWLISLGRRLEENDPRTVTRGLLGHLA